MTGQFDQNGDLWIEVDRSTLPENSDGLELRAEATFNPGASAGFAVTKLNLSAYMRSLTKPSWAAAELERLRADAAAFESRPAFLNSASAKVTIVGNTPTTGGAV